MQNILVFSPRREVFELGHSSKHTIMDLAFLIRSIQEHLDRENTVEWVREALQTVESTLLDYAVSRGEINESE